jgi:hypothetical protein
MVVESPNTPHSYDDCLDYLAECWYPVRAIRADLAQLRVELARAEGERDEAKREELATIEKAGAIGAGLMMKNDRILAENRALLEWLENAIGQLECYGNHSFTLPAVEPTAAEVERVKALEKVKTAYESGWRSPGPACTCDEAYRGRRREDPTCIYHQSPAVWDALAALPKPGEQT